MAVLDSPVPVTTVRRPMDARARRWRWMAPTMAALVALLILVSILVGPGNMLTPQDFWVALTGSDAPRLHQIALDTRFPRAFLALLTGAALGVAGALMQALTRNALASPDITGVSAGCVAAVLAWLAFGPPLSPAVVDLTLPLLALGGGLATAGVVYLMSRRMGTVESTRFIMIGILFGGILSSLSTISLIFLGTGADRILGWLTGSLSLKTWEDLQMCALYLAPALVLLPFVIPRANALQLGDGVARALGQRQDVDRLLVLIVAIVLTAGSVAIVGAIGFVGLLAPHMVRRAVGSDLRRLVPATALAGALMVLSADLLARCFDPRVVMGPLGEDLFSASLPVGVYLDLFGVPFLVVLLWKTKGAS